MERSKAHWLNEAIDHAVQAAFNVGRKHARGVVYQLLVTVTNHAIIFLGNARTIDIVRDVVDATPRFHYVAQMPSWCKAVIRGGLSCRPFKHVADEGDMGLLGRIVDAEVYAMLWRVGHAASAVTRRDNPRSREILAEELEHLRRYRAKLNRSYPFSLEEARGTTMAYDAMRSDPDQAFADGPSQMTPYGKIADWVILECLVDGRKPSLHVAGWVVEHENFDAADPYIGSDLAALDLENRTATNRRGKIIQLVGEPRQPASAIPALLQHMIGRAEEKWKREGAKWRRLH